MNEATHYTKKTAAKQLGLSVAKLNQLMIELGVFDKTKKLPRKEYRLHRFFKLQPEQYTLPGYNMGKCYTKLLITNAGLEFIQRLLQRYNQANNKPEATHGLHA